MSRLLSSTTRMSTGAPDPREVTPSTGRVVYRLLQAGGAGDAPGAQRGVLAVEMLDAAAIRIEALADGSATDLPITPAARRYVR
jgi:hypothetical protein